MWLLPSRSSCRASRPSRASRRPSTWECSSAPQPSWSSAGRRWLRAGSERSMRSRLRGLRPRRRSRCTTSGRSPRLVTRVQVLGAAHAVAVDSSSSGGVGPTSALELAASDASEARHSGGGRLLLRRKEKQNKQNKNWQPCLDRLRAPRRVSVKEARSHMHILCVRMCCDQGGGGPTTPMCGPGSWPGSWPGPGAPRWTLSAVWGLPCCGSKSKRF